MMWTNDGIPFVANSLITEFDIRRGNTSIMHTFNLMPDSDISYLENLPKKDRNVKVGLLQRNDRKFAKELEQGFTDVVDQFIKVNNLDKDVDILAIRRDAVFVINHPITCTKIGKFVEFIPKSVYHASLQLKRLEFYFGSNHTVDIKNFIATTKKENEKTIKKLEPGMLSFLSEFIDVCEESMMNKKKIYKYLSQFCSYYKEKKLDLEYYREFTRDAMFRIHSETGDAMMDTVPEYMVDDIDISYNYVNIIIPLLQISI